MIFRTRIRARRRLLVVAATLLLAAAGARADREQDVATALVAAAAAGEPLPHASILLPAADVAAAYRIASRVVMATLAGREPAGFKAGLMDRALQQRFGLDEPFAGVLYPGTALDSGAAVVAGRFPGLVVESEIGFVIDREVTAPIPDVETMQHYVRAVVPVAELVRTQYAPGAPLTGIDVIAANTGAALYVRGAPLGAMPAAALNALAVTLSRDGVRLHTAAADTALGNQYEALRWLVNKVLALGWAVGPGQLLITGALGTPVPATPGRYRIDYGTVASIDLLVL